MHINFNEGGVEIMNKGKKFIRFFIVFVILLLGICCFPYVMYFVYQKINAIISNEEVYKAIDPANYIALIETLINCVTMATLSYFAYQVSKLNGQINKEQYKIQNKVWATQIYNELEKQAEMLLKFYKDTGVIQGEIKSNLQEGIISLHINEYITYKERKCLELYVNKISQLLYKASVQNITNNVVTKDEVREILTYFYSDYQSDINQYSEKFEKIIRKLKKISRKRG